MIRDDLSNKLIHFTKGTPEEATVAFRSIIKEEKLRGGTGFIKGGFKCVCFTESPIAKFPHILASPKAFDFPYAPLGIMVSKLWLYKQGGRPVIYQPDEEYDDLNDNQKYRHKRYEPDKNIDFTWEREWRIKTDSLRLDPYETTLIVRGRSWEKELFQDHADIQRSAIMALGDVGASYIEPCLWHFIVLEDLGVKVDWR